jgi:hypothetical protein
VGPKDDFIVEGNVNSNRDGILVHRRSNAPTSSVFSLSKKFTVQAISIFCWLILELRCLQKVERFDTRSFRRNIWGYG